MGEARRRKEALVNGPCLCGSGMPSRGCCYDGTHWRKTPSILGLKQLPKGSVVEKCYMKELGSCSGSISGEHLISESVIHVLRSGGDFTVSGVPWLPKGEVRKLSPKALVTNCLCRKHNSALAKLDDAACAFFSALKSCLNLEPSLSRQFITSGHDLERWLLKTTKAMAVSGNFARGRVSLPGVFASDVSVLDMLDDPQSWPAGTGLYCVMAEGHLTENHNRFQLQPYMNAFDEIVGLGVNIMGLGFILMLEPPILSNSLSLQGARFRPGEITISYPSGNGRIEIHWQDNAKHDALSMKFLRKIEPKTA